MILKVPFIDLYISRVFQQWIISPSRRQIYAAIRTENNIQFYKEVFSNYFGNNKIYVYDVGSNIGYTNILFSLMGNVINVLAFEVYRINIKYLLFNTRNREKIIMITAGISNSIELLKFGMPKYALLTKNKKANTGLITSTKVQDTSSSTQISGVVLPLDAFYLDKPSFIKIDVEGMEINVLRGSKLFFENRSLIEFEYNLRITDSNFWETINSLCKKNKYLCCVKKNALKDLKDAILVDLFLVPDEKYSKLLDQLSLYPK